MSCLKIEPLKRITIPGVEECLIFKVDKHQVESLNKLLKSENNDTVYRIQQVDKIRSPQQNNLFHGPILDAIVNWTGDTDREYFKAYLKHKFLTSVGENGKKQTRRTSKLTKEEFSVFITKCVQWIIDQGGGAYLPKDINL